jgi:hypothetical protein
MTNKEILEYLARCQCSVCVKRREEDVKEKSLKELFLDDIFTRVKEQLARDMSDEFKKRQKSLVSEFIQFFERSIEKKAAEMLAQAFDASCAYGFIKQDVENESH